MLSESDDVWASPPTKCEAESPPEASPKKAFRVASGFGPSFRSLEDGASGETPLTTTASTSRTVHVCGSPMLSPDASPEQQSNVQVAAHISQLHQAQFAMDASIVALSNARDHAARHMSGTSSREGDSEKGFKASSRRAGRQAPVLPRGLDIEGSHTASRYSVHKRAEGRRLERSHTSLERLWSYV